MYNESRSFGRNKAELEKKGQGQNRIREATGKKAHVKTQAETIMAYKGKMAGKKMTKQLTPIKSRPWHPK